MKCSRKPLIRFKDNIDLVFNIVMFLMIKILNPPNSNGKNTKALTFARSWVSRLGVPPGYDRKICQNY